MHYTTVLLAVFGTTAFAAPQIDFGCTLSCGVWNACRARAVIDGDPLTDCGAEPNRCNCQQFADSKRDIPVARAPEPQIDFGCTLSCSVWNGCRARAVIEGEPLTQCGAEPDKCNCQQFADFKERREVEARAPEPEPVPQIDFGCTLSCGVWNGCRARAVIEGEPLTQCGAEPDKCNCQQFADFKERREVEARAPEPEPVPQIDFGCTLSCGVWNGCRARAVIEGEPLTQCGAEPNKCNCQQFADFKA